MVNNIIFHVIYKEYDETGYKQLIFAKEREDESIVVTRILEDAEAEEILKELNPENL